VWLVVKFIKIKTEELEIEIPAIHQITDEKLLDKILTYLILSHGGKVDG
jgi:hypothetical protein